MAQNKMLIDASHPEETRVVVVKGNRVDEFDFESENKTQIRGNIYLAKVTRVEPSLQAAFVDYGGNRHGFLAFSEIHPDYYQIPVADRQALLEEEAAEAAADDEAHEESKPAPRRRRSRRRSSSGDKKAASEAKAEATAEDTSSKSVETPAESDDSIPQETASSDSEPSENSNDNPSGETSAADSQLDVASSSTDDEEDTPPESIAAENESDVISQPADEDDNDDMDDSDEDETETVGSEDALEEVPVRRPKRRHYKIQEVIKRRQIILVQVVKEERGNKGAALTTYLSLAGRYSVLMPNTARGGGISRKITNVTDRKRLKAIASDLDVAEGMGVILRTAGASRTKAEIRRDFEYLLRLWENVRNLTLDSTAPCLVYEEGSLIKRSIRDLYNKDIGEIQISGEDAYREAKDFMRMLMPSHARNVKRYTDPVPIFTRNNVEAQLDKVLQPQVTLKSGGYLVINQTEALVAIDVNSGRSTRQHSIEDTATQTNLEAAEEVARQLRLRDLAGLIVIDFIDMEENRNNRAVEKRLKEALKNDRARIQVSRISHFGLLEMSRQRIRASVLESTTEICPTCEGIGHVRSVSSIALFVLRSIEEHILKNSRHNVIVKTSAETAIYLLNTKRMSLIDLEARFGLTITIEADNTIGMQYLTIERGELATPRAKAETHVQVDSIQPDMNDFDDTAIEDEAVAEPADEDERPKRKRRRRRRGRGRSENVESTEEVAGEEVAASDTDLATSEDGETAEPAPAKRRRRGRRGGKARSDVAPKPEEETDIEAETVNTAESPVEAEKAEEEKKPGRNRRPRKAKKAETAAESTAAEDAKPGEETTGEEEAPKKRTRRPRKKKVEDTSSEVVEEAAGEEEKAPRRTTRRPRKKKVEDGAGEATEVAAGEEEKAPPRSTRRPRKKKSGESVAEKAPDSKVSAEVESAPVEEPARKPRRTTRRKTKAESAPEAEATPEPDKEADGSEKGEEKKDGKAGWWQRHGFF